MTRSAKLASAEVIPYALPFREPYVTARGTLLRREMVLLRLRDGDGLVGLGEAVPLSLRGGAPLARVEAELRELAESGRLHTLERAEPEEAGRWIDSGSGLSAPARCAVHTALGDLAERRAAGERLDPGPVPCNATLTAGEPAAVAEGALRWAAEGFGTFKLKLGAGEDVAQVRAVREAVGPQARIRLDANGAWSLAEARRVLAEVEPLGIELVEQPVASLEETAELARSTAIPLAADESVASAAEAERAVAAGAFELTGVKIAKVGGVEAGARIAAVLPAYVASALDGPVGIAAGARLAQRLHHEGCERSAEPNAAQGCKRFRRSASGVAGGLGGAPLAHGLATQRLFASTIASVECALSGGELHVPPGHGLGVEIDEEALDAHRL